MRPSTPERIFITGASSGLGMALARAYAARGAVLGLVARRDDVLRELAAELKSAHGGDLCVTTFAVDVSDAQAMREAASRFIAAHGCPDVVIANAGVSVGVQIEEAEDLPVCARIMQINWLGLLATLSPFIEPMRARGSGTLAGIASVAGVRGLPGHAAYSASKAAAMRSLESLRVELLGSGVAVVTVVPGYVRTPLTARNRFPMPFLIDADVFARRALRALDRRQRIAVIPWPMAIVARLLNLLPAALYDRLLARRPRKSRERAGL